MKADIQINVRQLCCGRKIVAEALVEYPPGVETEKQRKAYLMQIRRRLSDTLTKLWKRE